MKKFLSLMATILMLSMTVFAMQSCNSTESYGSESDGSYYSKTDNSSIVTGDSVAVTTEQKLIKTCKIVAETKDFDTAVDAISNAITSAGGYIESQESNGQSYGSGKSVKTLSLTAKIPAEKLDAFNDEMTGLLNVTSYSSNVENVTEAYYDAEARLETLKAERDSLLEMLEGLDTAEQYNFWGEIRSQINDLEQEIAVLEAKLKNYDKLVAYSTVSIDLTEVKELTSTDEEEPSFGDRIGEAFSESWEDFGEGCQDFAVFFISAIPTLLVLAVIAGGVFCIIYFPMKHSEKKRKQRLLEEQNKFLQQQQQYQQNQQNQQK